MKREIIITEYENKILSALYEDRYLVQMRWDEMEPDYRVGDIYVGKVKNIVRNINAAFVEIKPGVTGYYSLEENKEHLFVNVKKNQKLVAGDEIIVQVEKDHLKTKAISLTSQLQLSARHLVLTAGKCTVGISRKIKDSDKREWLKALVSPFIKPTHGFVIRTNAADVSQPLIIQEAAALSVQLESILEKGRYALCYTCLFKGETSYMKQIRDYDGNGPLRLQTDLQDIYEDVQAVSGTVWTGQETSLELYNDPQLSLINLKSLKTHIERALKPQVWLKSGGSIVIVPTEALVVIDVNTGKFAGKKSVQDTFFKTNMEAAAEVARQLRLRNLSGIIIIDFIDMKSEEQQSQLIQYLKEVTSKDSTTCVVLGRTRLNLVEMTRKKEYRPLHEELGSVCKACSGTGVKIK